ncbi:hypothetical protein Hanom_Chr05g00418701 [Helianthus anomalus]
MYTPSTLIWTRPASGSLSNTSWKIITPCHIKIRKFCYKFRIPKSKNKEKKAFLTRNCLLEMEIVTYYPTQLFILLYLE